MNAWRFVVTLTILVGGAWTALTAGEAEPRSGAPGKQSARTPTKPRKPTKGVAQLPELNRKIIAFCEAHVGQQVGDGECAVLAQQALKETDGKPHHELTTPLPNTTADDYVWGQLLQPTDAVLPGDILQFRDVELKFLFPNGSRWTQSFSHHTAVVYRVLGPGQFVILQQNGGGPGTTEEQKRLVQPGTIDVRAMTKGMIWAYRPIAK